MAVAALRRVLDELRQRPAQALPQLLALTPAE
jgi:hypothetical protein